MKARGGKGGKNLQLQKGEANDKETYSIIMNLSIKMGVT
jgi:hypothetical protein